MNNNFIIHQKCQHGIESVRELKYSQGNKAHPEGQTN